MPHNLMQWAKRQALAVDVRFAPDDERAFKASLEADVVRYGIFGTLCSSAAFSCALTFHLSREFRRIDNQFHFAFNDARTFTIGVYLFVVVCNSLWICLAYLRLRWSLFFTWNWELLMFGPVLWTMFAVCLGNPWHGSLLFDQQPEQVWVHDAKGEDATVSLTIDACLTVVCLFVPIRCCVLWIMPVCMVAIYFIVQSCLGATFPENYILNMAILTILSLFAFMGAYRNEQMIRREWVASSKLKLAERELLESSAMSVGLENVAKFLCDLVITLSTDLCVISSQGEHAGVFESSLTGQQFHSILAASDQQRFDTLVRQVTTSGIPQCLSVTLSLKRQHVEASLFVVAALGHELRYIVGVNADLKGSPIIAYPLDIQVPGRSLQGVDELSAHYSSFPVSSEKLRVSSEPSESGTLLSLAFSSITTQTETQPENCNTSSVAAQVFIEMGTQTVRAESYTEVSIQTETQNAVARPPSLPAQKRTKSRRCTNGSSWSSTSPLDSLSNRSSEPAVPPADGIGEEHELDGSWIVLDPPSGLASFMHRLLIFGNIVVEKDHNQTRLQRDGQGNWLYHGAVLSKSEDLLQCTRKSTGEVVRWIRQDSTEPGQDSNVDEGEEDTGDYEGVVCCRIPTLHDLPPYEPALTGILPGQMRDFDSSSDMGV